MTAPIVVALEKRVNVRLLSAAGFALFGVGIAMSAFQDPQFDYDAMFWPQIVRGVAIMFRLLPPTRPALGTLSPDKVPDASGLFNLMGNLGGAIGIALIDPIIYTRSEPLGRSLLERLQAGDTDAAAFIGVPLQTLAEHKGGLDEATMAMLDPLLQKAATVQALNEAWLVIAVVTACAILCLPLAGRLSPCRLIGRR